MNTHGGMQDNVHNQQHLLLQLRGLRREELPGTDLWPGIAARIAQATPVAAAQGNNVVALRRTPARFAPWALAASLVLAVGVAWQQRPDTAAPSPDPSARLIQREAEAMTREYDAALRELQVSGNPVARDAALRELDRSAAQIRTALNHDPDARFLLDRLRSTYEKRLQLTQRAALA